MKEAPDNFISALKTSQRKLSEFIQSKIAQFERAGETITPSEANFLRVEELKAEALEYLKEKTNYKKVVKEFSSTFDEQKKENKEYFNTFDQEFSTTVSDRIVRNIKRDTVKKLISDSIIDSKIFLPLGETLDFAVANGAGFQATLTLIRDFIEGSEDPDSGVILKYSKQLAHDSFANADRAYGSAVADELEMEWFIYGGGLVDNTRCFCLERHNKFYHYKEVEAWGRGEDVGECGYPWKGMNRDTTEKTIYQYAGGYNCLHSIGAVSIFDVPKEDVQRNVDNGNYVPSEFEKEQIGITD